MHVNRLMKARIECTVYDSFFENEQIHVFRFYSASCGFGKERETWEGALKGLMERADMTSSQHSHVMVFYATPLMKKKNLFHPCQKRSFPQMY
jgi:hypothetical protein